MPGVGITMNLIAVAEATVPVLREGGMVGHIPLQAKPAEME